MGRRALPVLLVLATCALARVAASGTPDGFETQWDQRIAEARSLRLWIASAAALAVAAGWLAERRGRLPRVARGRDVLLVALSAATLFAWWHPHQGTMRSWHHVADSFHYYVGAKYFDELGYTRLYRCAVVADAEAGLAAQIAGRQIRDLETNRAESALTVLRDPSRCKRHFTDARWRDFTADVAWYRSEAGLPVWLGLRGDHGYNAPPTWTLLGSLLTRGARASRAQLLALTFIDPLLLAVTFVALALAFGWRVSCIALIYWGTNQPASWEWVGGSIVRFDWLAASVVGLCGLARGRPVLAGLLLAWAVGVRIFPIAIVAGVGLAAAQRCLRARRLSPTRLERRFAVAFAAGIAAIALLTSLVVGPGSLVAFAQNSRAHLATDSLNRIGLRPLLSFRHDARAALTVDATRPDGHARWRAERRSASEARWPFRVLAAVGHLVLLAVAVRRQPEWAAGLLGIGLLPFLVELGCYYYGLLLAFACLFPRRGDVAAGLLLLASASWWLGTWSGPDRDLISAWTSLTILVFVAYATVRMLRPVDAAPGAGPPATPVAGASGVTG